MSVEIEKLHENVHTRSASIWCQKRLPDTVLDDEIRCLHIQLEEKISARDNLRISIMDSRG